MSTPTINEPDLPGVEPADHADYPPDHLGYPNIILRTTMATVVLLAAGFGLAMGSVEIALSAIGTLGLAPMAAATAARLPYPRTSEPYRYRRAENAADTLCVAVVLWQPVVILTDLRDLLLQPTPSSLLAGVVAVFVGLLLIRG